jgi:hypothetical protein
MALAALTEETFHPIIKARVATKQGKAPPPAPPVAERMRMFVQIALIRPVHMLLFEPIVFFICLYVAAEFGTLFSFFAGVPYTFGVSTSSRSSSPGWCSCPSPSAASSGSSPS